MAYFKATLKFMGLCPSGSLRSMSAILLFTSMTICSKLTAGAVGLMKVMWGSITERLKELLQMEQLSLNLKLVSAHVSKITRIGGHLKNQVILCYNYLPS